MTYQPSPSDILFALLAVLTLISFAFVLGGLAARPF
jgi:hypothetical protein